MLRQDHWSVEKRLLAVTLGQLGFHGSQGLLICQNFGVLRQYLKGIRQNAQKESCNFVTNIEGKT